MTGSAPAFLEWMRYFVPLLFYPLAACCEGWLMYQAAPHATVGGFKGFEVYPLATFINYVYLPLWLPCFYFIYSSAINSAKKRCFGEQQGLPQKATGKAD